MCIDTFSYLLGKKKGGGGADLSNYFTSTISNGASSSIGGYVNMIKKIPDDTTVSGTSLNYAFSNFLGTEVPLLDTSNVTSMTSMFNDCINLTTIPLLDMSSCTSATNMFSGCTNLANVPLLNTSNLSRMNMFSNCPKLTDASLDNILKMCINSNVTTATRKKLSDVGLTSTNYPTSRIEALPSYQDFIDAGWTIGY